MKKEINFNLKINKDSFYTNQSGSTIGIIFFEVDGYIFPSNDWYDFVVVLLYWLSKSIIDLIIKKETMIEMDFMEGPLKVSLILDQDDQCTINFIEGEKLAGDEEIIHRTITVPFSLVKNEVVKACKIVVQSKESGKIPFNDDYKNLKTTYDLLLKY